MERKKEKKVEKVDKQERDLRVAVLQAVIFGHLDALERAGKVLNEHYKKYRKSKGGGRNVKVAKTTGAQTLDFIMKEDFKVRIYYSAVQCSSGNSRAETLQVQSQLLPCFPHIQAPAQHQPQCRTHSPLMLALELKKEDLARKLLQLGASVAFKNEVC